MFSFTLAFICLVKSPSNNYFLSLRISMVVLRGLSFAISHGGLLRLRLHNCLSGQLLLGPDIERDFCLGLPLEVLVKDADFSLSSLATPVLPTYINVDLTGATCLLLLRTRNLYDLRPLGAAFLDSLWLILMLHLAALFGGTLAHGCLLLALVKLLLLLWIEVCAVGEVLPAWLLRGHHVRVILKHLVG